MKRAFGGYMKRNQLNKIIRHLIVSIITILSISGAVTFAEVDERIATLLTPEEINWLQTHGEDIFYVGLDPDAGMEYFQYDDREMGYLSDIVQLLSEKLDIKMQIRPDLSWSEAVSGLQSDEIQVLFGANPTPERLKTMRFTDAIYSVPYTVLGRVMGEVQNIGDLNHKKVGFLAGDVANTLIQEAYPNLSFDFIYYDNQEVALAALNRGQISAFITSGGDVVYDYLFRFPSLRVIANIEDIRSLLTFSTLIENERLVNILSKTFASCEVEITALIDEARTHYVRKILNLTEDEEAWMRNHPQIKVGVPTDYLPIDYPVDGEYKGIAGHYLTAFADLIGLEIIAVPGTFDDVYDKIQNGEIDLLNMAKTDDRLRDFVFTEAFSNERDLIYGLRDSKYIHDIYGLEGKRVAVIRGFWHIDHLNMNLREVELILTDDIKGAIEAVVTGKADYFIETPAVADFYISGLGYTNIIKKGETSSDSFLTFGMLPEHAPLASIFNRARLLISYEDAKYLGIQGLPEVANVANKRLIAIIIGISTFLILLIIALMKVLRDLWLTRERERLIYIDPLTGLYNRGYFNQLETTANEQQFPQSLFVLDINLLKDINDSYGHHQGDRLIDAVSTILTETAKTYNGSAIRMGGDEFVLVFFGMSKDKAVFVADALRKTFESSSLLDGEKVLLSKLEVAIGFSHRDDASVSFEVLAKHADHLMYANKAEMKANGA